MRRSGWFNESRRHALARRGIETAPKFGSVGWQESMLKTISYKMKHGEKLSPQERAFIPVQMAHLSRMKDADRDGVPDRFDCSPHDPTKQDYELSPQYDSRKSFYRKAMVRRDDGKLILRSYSTDVAYIEDGKAVVRGTYSPTTLRHIKEFLKQNGFRADTSSQILKDYPEGRDETPPATTPAPAPPETWYE